MLNGPGVFAALCPVICLLTTINIQNTALRTGQSRSLISTVKWRWQDSYTSKNIEGTRSKWAYSPDALTVSSHCVTLGCLFVHFSYLFVNSMKIQGGLCLFYLFLVLGKCSFQGTYEQNHLTLCLAKLKGIHNPKLRLKGRAVKCSDGQTGILEDADRHLGPLRWLNSQALLEPQTLWWWFPRISIFF